MTTTITKNEYRNHDNIITLVLTIEQEMTMPEVTQKIAQLMFSLASVESQMMTSPDNAELAAQKTNILNDINVYQNYKAGFPSLG